MLGCARLSFGKAELLEEVMGVAPGGFAPFALSDDRNPRLDRALLECERLCHPLTKRPDHHDRRHRSAEVHRGLGHEPRIPDLGAAGSAAS